MKGIILLWFTFLASIFVAGFGLILAFQYYTKYLEIQLDPTNAFYYSTKNQQLVNRLSNKQLIVLFGDSRMELWKSPPVSSRYEIVNRGISGDTTALSLLRLQKDVIALKPNIVVIQVGINDLKAIGVLPEKSEWIVERLKLNIIEMIAQLKRHDIHVLMMTILPVANPNLIRRFVWSPEISLAVNDLNSFILGLSGDGVSVINCKPEFDIAGNIRTEFVLDTLHMNEKGYEVLSKLLKRSLKIMDAHKARMQN